MAAGRPRTVMFALPALPAWVLRANAGDQARHFGHRARRPVHDPPAWDARHLLRGMQVVARLHRGRDHDLLRHVAGRDVALPVFAAALLEAWSCDTLAGSRALAAHARLAVPRATETATSLRRALRIGHAGGA